MQDNKKIIVDTIQKAMQDCFIDRKQTNLSYNNHMWVANYNYIFSELEKLDGKNGLFVRTFQRHSYKMACIYNESEKTLFTICSENRFESLRRRTVINPYHFTDAFSLLSCDVGTHKQLNMFGEEVEIETREDLRVLLNSLMVSFNGEFDIRKYCILACKFDHRLCQLYSIKANYMAQNYEVVKEDNWTDYIVPNYDVLDEELQSVEAVDLPVDIKVKDNIKIRLKEKKSRVEEERV